MVNFKYYNLPQYKLGDFVVYEDTDEILRQGLVHEAYSIDNNWFYEIDRPNKKTDVSEKSIIHKISSI